MQEMTDTPLYKADGFIIYLGLLHSTVISNIPKYCEVDLLFSPLYRVNYFSCKFMLFCIMIHLVVYEVQPIGLPMVKKHA